MTTLREAAQQALEALEKAVVAFGPGLTLQQNAITALRQALAEQDDDLTAAWMAGAAEERKRAEQPQPVAWMVKDEGLYWTEEAAIHRADKFVEPLDVVPLYTTPPAALAQQANPLINQCGETCERAKLCAVCASKMAEQPQPLTDKEILSVVGWERAEMWMKLAPNFPVDEAKQETLKNARAVEAEVLKRMGVGK